MYAAEVVVVEAQRLVAGLRRALVAQAAVDQAVGVIMSRSGASASEAAAWLRRRSEDSDTMLNRLAQTIIDEAARKA